MNGRVQGLDPAIEEFRHSGDLRHLVHRNPGGGEGLRGATGRDYRHAARDKRTGEFNDPTLVADRNQRAADRKRGCRHCRGYKVLRSLGKPQEPRASAVSRIATVAADAASETAPHPFSDVQPQPIRTKAAAITRST